MAGKTTWIIGSAPDCDVVIDRDAVSSRHCQLAWIAPVFVLDDLRSTNGTFVNGRRITSPTHVTRADEIILGSQIPIQWPDSQIAGIRDTVTIGREPDNDITLDYPMVSGYHAQLIVEGGRTFIQDAGSANGIAIGAPSSTVKRAELSSKDTIFFGSFEISARELLAKAVEKRRQRQPVRQPVAASTSPPAKPTTGDSPTQQASFQNRIPRVAVAAVVVSGLLIALAILNRSYISPAANPTVSTDLKSEPISSPPQNVAALTSGPSQSNGASATAASSSVPKQDVKPTKEMLERSRNAVVWVGLRVRAMSESTLFSPFASAFAVQPKTLVTTASVVSDLEKASREDGFSVVAYQDGQEIPVDVFKVHPKYDAQNPTSAVSIEHNVGMLGLRFPSIATIESASAEAVNSLSLESSLNVIGVTTTLTPTDEYDRLKVKVEDTLAKIVGTVSDRSGFKPVYKLSVSLPLQQSQRLLDGAPVFDGTNRMVGILSTTHSPRMVTASVISQLLSQ